MSGIKRRFSFSSHMSLLPTYLFYLSSMWSRILVEKLIHKYRQHEHLYNSNHPFYADRARRAASLQDICRSLNKINKNITVYELKKKIHTLRSQYLKELRDMGKSRQEGVTGVIEPKLWCYDKLDFLKYHCHTKYSTIDDVEVRKSKKL